MLCTPLTWEVILWIFHISFIYAAVSFAFEPAHQSYFTAIFWLITAILSQLYIQGCRHHRDVSACIPLRFYHSSTAQSSFKYLTVLLLLVAVFCLVEAVVEGHDLNTPQSLWLTLIAVLMAAKWAFLVQGQMTVLKGPSVEQNALLSGGTGV